MNDKAQDRIKPHLPNLDKYREIVQSKKRSSLKDLSWELDELAAARPSIRRAEKLGEQDGSQPRAD